MTIKTSILALCVLFLTGAAAAQQHESVVELAISDGTADEDIVIRIDSKQDGFNLHELQPGESRSLTTTDGRPVTVTRAAESFEFDVEGRTISMPVMEHADGPPMHHGGPHQREVRIVREVGPGGPRDAEAVTIISHQALDAATQAAITSALQSAGLNKVEFIDTSDMVAGHPPGPPDKRHPVRIIRKKIHVTD